MHFAIAMIVKVGLVLWLGTQGFAKLVNRDDAEWIKGRPFQIVMLFYVVGMLGYSVFVFYIVMVAVLPIIATSRGEAAALYIVAAGAAPDLPYELSAGSLYLLILGKWMMLSIGLLITVLLKPRIGPRPAMRFHLPFIIMLLLDLMQARGLNFTSTSRVMLSVFLSEGLAYFAFVSAVGRVADLRRVMLAFCYVGFVLAIVATFEAITHQLAYAPMNGQLGTNSIAIFRMMKMRGGILRSPTVFGDPTTFAQFLVVVLMATLSYRYSFRSTRALAIALGVITLGIFFTSTRNAWIGVLIGVIAFDLFRKRYLALSGKVAVLGVGYGVLLLLAEFVPYFRTMLGGDSDTSDTANYRSRLLTRGIEEFHKHPVFGTDLASVLKNLADMRQGEGLVDIVNAYLLYALTVGTVGIVGLVLVFLLPIIVMLRIRRRMFVRGIFLERTCSFVFAVGMIYLVTSAFTIFGGQGSIFFYLVLAVGAILFSWRELAVERLAESDRVLRPVIATPRPVPLILMERPDALP